MIPIPGLVQNLGGGPLDVTINIDASVSNVNLLTLFETMYSPAVSGDTVRFIIDDGVRVTSSSATLPSLHNPATWAAGVNVFLTNNATAATDGVVGAGGNGSGPSPGQDGGTALLIEYPINIDNNGTFSGGGGGGAGTDQLTGQPIGGSQSYQAGGGGGAGSAAGVGRVVTGNDNNANGSSGSLTTGGSGGSFGSDPNQPTNPSCSGGSGGDLGQPGNDASDVGELGAEDNVGGAAGLSIDGLSFVTFTNMGALVGPTNA